MEIKHVDGKNKGEVFLYALSTCVWCKKTKRLLSQLEVQFDYIDVDLLEPGEKEEVVKEIKRWNPRCTYPTLVINKEICIPGYKENEIREVLD